MISVFEFCCLMVFFSVRLQANEMIKESCSNIFYAKSDMCLIFEEVASSSSYDKNKKIRAALALHV